jgi:hypothetical protein
VLLSNGSNFNTRFLAGTLEAVAPLYGIAGRRLYSNAGFFGTDTSWPQGYTQITRAWVPPLVASGQIAARLALSVDLTAAIGATANAEASIALDVDMTANANVRANAYATIAFDIDLTAGIRGTANAAAVFDLVGRPSAVDIAQEVWNGFTVENGLAPAEVLRILLAVAAGKTDIAGSGPTIVTFRDTADTKNRVRASMTGSERDAVTIDGA